MEILKEQTPVKISGFRNRIAHFLSRFKFPRTIVRAIINMIEYSILTSNNGVILYDRPERTRIARLVKAIRKQIPMCLLYSEAYQIAMSVEKTKKIEGDIAEVGVFRGASAKIICEIKGDKKLHLFDTFEGLPGLDDNDDHKIFRKGQYSSPVEGVKNVLKQYQNVDFHKGFFPKTADPVKNTRFSFVHLDTDLYASTNDGLHFFYPRMNKGGMILSHDYTSSPGVKKAVDEFFADKSEHVIEMAGTHCLVIRDGE